MINKTMKNFLVWLQKDTGTYRGQLVPNWFHVIVFIIILINVIIYFVKKRRR
jgi:hypothetical protein